MKSTIAAACALLAAGFASAQSTVTLYGTVDQFINRTTSGSRSLTQLADGGNAASRLGFRGAEDLGDGLHASFVLEAGLNADTGTGTIPGPQIAFTRQSYVGLGGAWGRVDAGRMYTPLFYALLRADPFLLNARFSPLLLAGQTDAQPGLATPMAFRASNMLRYRSPAGQALVIDMAYAFGESSAASRRSGEFYGGMIGYDKTPFYAAWTFDRARSGSVTAPVVTRTDALSARFDASDALKLNANFIRVSASNPLTPRARLLNLGVSWQVGLSRWTAGAIRRDVEGSPRGQTGWTLGYDYSLSKRTTLYVRLLHLSNKGRASASVAGIIVTPDSGNGVSSSGIGIRHDF